jgi:eukaryotic-like serine/threonine-protein kinase
MRILAGSMMALSLLGAVVAASFEGDALTKLLAYAAMGILFAAHAFMWVRAGREGMDQSPLAFCVYVFMCLAIAVANFAFGPLSPFGIAVAIGIMMFSSSFGALLAHVSYGTIMLGFAAGALTVRFGGYTRPALAPVAFSQPWMWDTSIVLVMVMYTAAHAVGRLIRLEQAESVENLERAMREAAARDALLREARDALRKVAGIGAPGRFSEQELDGFRLGPVIGRGGMGEVYAAERLADGRQAALKLLRMDVLSERSALARFEREPRIVASIRSPHVVELLSSSDADSVLPYIAMERLSGEDLASYLRDRERMSLHEVVELVSQVSVGLSAAHTAQVVHRDLKPSNLFRSGPSERPIWKILDFGISKWMDSAEATLSAGDLVGTPHYMAPEQARGDHDVDPRADVYALAAIAYRALTGEAPFMGGMAAILRRIADDMPKAPSSLAPLPRAVDYVLALGLAKRQKQRFQTAFELAAALNMAAADRLSPQLTKRAQELLRVHPYANEDRRQARASAEAPRGAPPT